MKRLTAVCAALMLGACVAGVSAGERYLFQDTTLTDDARVDDLMSRLTLDEKIGLLSPDMSVPRLGIPLCCHVEGLHGLSLGGPGKDEEGVPTTIFPQAYGLGETWDPGLLERIAAHVAEEARYYSQRPGADRLMLVMRAPNADLARDVRWGRTEESFGEDPCLTATMTVAKIKGLQGRHPRYWKTASLMKHFLANSNEFGRDSSSSDFGERLFREYYSYPFYKGITEGGSRAFMAAYNGWNGIPMAMHPCLDAVARKQWGNNGIICTDGSALRLMITSHKQFPTRAEGAAAIIRATTGQFLDDYVDDVREAMARGLLTEQEIDRAIRGNLFVALKLGLLDGPDSNNPYMAIGVDTTAVPPYLSDYARALAREATAKSMVLLKNDAVGASGKPLLPVDMSRVKKIALIGPYADKIVQDWYSGKPPYEVTVLQGIRNAVAGKDIEVLYAEDNRMDQAVKIAREADLAIVCVGNHPFGTKRDWFFCPVPSDGREAVDRRALVLPDEELVKQVTGANPSTVLLLVSSFPYAINWSAANVPAILHVTHCSQEQGNGVADVVFGAYNPAGRTTQTWPADIMHLPPMMDYDITDGHTYMYFRHKPLFPFGYGLSYTTFAYSDIEARIEDGNLHVGFTLANSGARRGEEVAQLYVAVGPSTVYKLKAFERTMLDAGESRRMNFVVPLSDIGGWDENSSRFAIDPGAELRLAVGASSADVRLKDSVRFLGD